MQRIETREFNGQPVEFLLKPEGAVYVNANQLLAITGKTLEEFLADGENAASMDEYEKAIIKFNLQEHPFTVHIGDEIEKKVIPIKEDPYEFIFLPHPNKSRDIFLHFFPAHSMLTWTEHHELYIWFSITVTHDLRRLTYLM